jgi:hypothetical protein
MRNVKKTIVHSFAHNSRTDRDISKIPTDLDSAGQNHFRIKIYIKNSVTVKNNPKL